MLKYIQIIDPILLENCYLIWDNFTKYSYIIDPGNINILEIDKIVNTEKLKVLGIVNTHGHWDHIFNNNILLKSFNISLSIHKDDNEFLINPNLNLSNKYNNIQIISKEADIFLNEKSILNIGKEDLRILHTPGHTPGSIILYNNDLIFTGDTLFVNVIGRCDLPKGDIKRMKNSLKRIKLLLPKNAKVLPGHGVSKFRFSQILKNNIFLKETNY